MDGRGGDDDDEFIARNSTVNVAAATLVTAAQQSSATPAHTIAEISVGSLIDVFGTASKDSSGNVTLDATSGRVRLDFTQVQGALSGSGSGNITLVLKTIDRQPVSLFNFAGTGSAGGVNSDPTRYVVTTGALDVSQFSMGAALLSVGFVSPFGTAPPDFRAVTVASVVMGGNNNGNNCTGDGDSNNCMCNGNSGGSASNNCMCNGDGDGNGNCMCPGNNDGGGNSCMCNGNSGGSGSNNCVNNATSAELDIDWSNPGTTKPFKSLTATGLDLDVTNSAIGGDHEIEMPSQTIDIKSLGADVSIAGAGSGMTLFAINRGNGREIDNFGSFADFEAALSADLNGTTAALRLTAEGVYNAAGSTFTAQRITILLSN
jgi:hypothetical protein